MALAPRQVTHYKKIGINFLKYQLNETTYANLAYLYFLLPKARFEMSEIKHQTRVL